MNRSYGARDDAELVRLALEQAVVICRFEYDEASVMASRLTMGEKRKNFWCDHLGAMKSALTAFRGIEKRLKDETGTSVLDRNMG